MILNVVRKSAIRIMFPEELKRYSFYIKPTVRLCLIVVFVISTVSITVSWTSAISLILLLVSYLFFKTKDNDESESEGSGKGKMKFTFVTKELPNPFKGKTGTGHLAAEKEVEIAMAIENYCVDDAEDANSLERFEAIKTNTECVFAKKAKLWGSCDYNHDISLEDNIRRLYPTFLKFTFAFLDLGLGAFVIELPGSLFGDNIETFSQAVRQTLVTLKSEDKRRIYKQSLKKKKFTADSSKPEDKDEDPIEKPSEEDTRLWEKRKWVFEINNITFFITTFAPFYPETNSRYAFGCKDCYILFQPEISFAVQDLPPDTPKTNWTCPVTVRDKIRVAFNNAGRFYDPSEMLEEPLVFDMVKRVSPEDKAVRWWDTNSEDATKVD